ncbi:hypothetical protein [Sphingobium fuliginis]|jgi:hypothetical protein|uniref:hypothetical protein n=1 Tax=Sphingobium fuliginis (strain ATCC 27551) TaxID=336203 RepID=UPI0037CBBB28
MTPDIIAALEAFAAYADPRRSVPASMPVTSGSSMARKQLTMGDCYAAADALAALSTSPAGQEVRAPWIEAKELEALVAILDNPPAKALRSELVAAMLKAGQVIRDQSAALSPSVEPAGNGREAVENAFIAGWEAQKAGRSFAAAMNDHIPALSSPPAADQEAVKCKRCNDTGWTIGNGTVREGCLSCDAQINMVRATPPAPALDVVSEAYRRGIYDAKCWLRDQQHKNPPDSLGHAAAILADRMDVALLSSPSEGESAPASSGAGGALREALEGMVAIAQAWEAADSRKNIQLEHSNAYKAALRTLNLPLTGWIVWDGQSVPSVDRRDSRKGFIWFTHETEREAIERGQSEIFYWPWYGEDEQPCVRAYALATPLSHDAEGESATVSREGLVAQADRRSSPPQNDAGVEGLREAIERFIADYDDGDRADAGTNPLMQAHIADLRAALRTPMSELQALGQEFEAGWRPIEMAPKDGAQRHRS